MKFAMFNMFFNWLDPKILNMEKWVNEKVIEPDKIDIDLDKVKKGEVRDTEMFNRTIPTKEGHQELGPFITNLQNADLLAVIFGPGDVEAFALYDNDNELWWRHRDGGTTHDFRVDAFQDMQEFVSFVDSDIEFWDCVLRTEALFADKNWVVHPKLKISEIKNYVDVAQAIE